MYQIGDNQLTHGSTYCQSVFLEWNGPAFSWHDKSEFSTVLLVLEHKVLVLHKLPLTSKDKTSQCLLLHIRSFQFQTAQPVGLPVGTSKNWTLLTYFQAPCGSQKLRVWICMHMYLSVYLCPVRAEIFNRTSCPKTEQSGSKPDTWQPYQPGTRSVRPE